jgi:hypothetical protein
MASVETTQSAKSAEAVLCMCATDDTMPAEDVSMTVPEAAKALRRSREYSGLRKGRFPGSKLGRTYLMPRAFIQGFVRDVLSVGRPTSFEEYAAAWLSRAGDEVAA